MMALHFGIFGINAKICHAMMNSCTKISKPTNECLRNGIWGKCMNSFFIIEVAFSETVPPSLVWSESGEVLRLISSRGNKNSKRRVNAGQMRHFRRTEIMGGNLTLT